jgi:hypothetical protein
MGDGLEESGRHYTNEALDSPAAAAFSIPGTSSFLSAH